MLAECSRIVKELWSGRHTQELKHAEKQLLDYQASEQGWSLASECLNANEYALILLGGQVLECKIRNQDTARPNFNEILKLILHTLLRLDNPLPDVEFKQPATNKTVSLISLLYSHADDLMNDLQTDVIVQTVDYVKSPAALCNLFLAISEIPNVLQQRLAMCYEPGEAAFVIPYFQSIDKVICNVLQSLPEMIRQEKFDMLQAALLMVGSHIPFLRKLPDTIQVYPGTYDLIVRIATDSTPASRIRCMEHGGLAQFAYQTVVGFNSRVALLIPCMQAVSADPTNAIQMVENNNIDVSQLPILSAKLEAAIDWLVQACAEAFSDYKLPSQLQAIQPMFEFLRSSCFLGSLKISASVIEAVDTIAETLKSHSEELESNRAPDQDVGTVYGMFASQILSVWLPHVILAASICEPHDVQAFAEGAFNGIALVLPVYAQSLEALNLVLAKSFTMTYDNNAAMDEYWKAIGDSLVITFGQSPKCQAPIFHVMRAMITARIFPGVHSLLRTGCDILSNKSLELLLSTQDTLKALVQLSVQAPPKTAVDLLADLSIALYNIDYAENTTLLYEVQKYSVVNLEIQTSHEIVSTAHVAMYTRSLQSVNTAFAQIIPLLHEATSLELLRSALTYVFVVLHIAFDLLGEGRSPVWSEFSCRVVELAATLLHPLLRVSQQFLIDPSTCQRDLRRTGRNYGITRQGLMYQLKTAEHDEEGSADRFSTASLVYHSIVLLLFLTFDSIDFDSLLDSIEPLCGKTFPSEPGFIGLVEQLSRMLAGHQRSRLLHGILNRCERTGWLLGSTAVTPLAFDSDIDAEPHCVMLRCLLKVYTSLTSISGKRNFALPLTLSSNEGISRLQRTVFEIISKSTNSPLLSEACNLMLLIANEADKPHIAKLVIQRYTKWPHSSVGSALKIIEAYIYQPNDPQLIRDFVLHVVLAELGLSTTEECLVQGLTELRGRLLMKVYEDLWRLKNNELLLADVLLQVDLTRQSLQNRGFDERVVIIEED